MTRDEGISWYGWNNSKSGYGIVNLEYSTALERLTGKVTYGWEREEDVSPESFALLTDEQKTLLRKPFKLERIGIIKTTPQLFYQNKSQFRIGYTMVENTQVGQRWVDYINAMDAVFVPSEYLVNVFKNSGVKPPVISVKQGIDSRKFPYMERPTKDKFIFGTVGYQDERKNWQDLIRAFSSEFSSGENVELWIKNSNAYFSHMAFTDHRIKIINKYYTFEQMREFYRLINCFVFPSHAEGSGLPPREAMATGLPTILTNWSGLTEMADSKISYPIDPVAIDIPDVRGPDQPGFMARIDIQELMYWMRYVYEHRSEALSKGKLASVYVHKEWNWDACAKDMYNKLQKF